MANTQQSQQMANAIRALAMDAVQQANSGHPGAPHGHGRHGRGPVGSPPQAQPHQPQWFDRDRFVLSNGHGSMLIYSLLHLTGYDLPMSELKNFRQLHSKTAGHPEVGITPAWKPPPARWARASPTPGLCAGRKAAGCRVQPRRPCHR